MGRKPSIWTPADRHYEQLRVGMQALFNELGDRCRRIDNSLPIADRQDASYDELSAGWQPVTAPA